MRTTDSLKFMAKLNSNLLNSLLIDIKEFNNFVNDINSINPLIRDNKHLSWKYPHKLSKNVNSMDIIKKRRGTAGEMYILLLEIAYDRIHFVLELIVDFLAAVKGFKKQKQSKEKFTSPAGTINQILMQLKSFSYKANSGGDGMDFGVGGIVTRGTQAKSCLQCCEHCSVVCQCLGELVRRIEGMFRDGEFNSQVGRVRESVKTRIGEATQWEVVTKLSEALTNDVEGIMKEWKAVRDENEGLREERGRILLNLGRAKRDLGVRRFEVDEMITRFDEMKREIILLGDLIFP